MEWVVDRKMKVQSIEIVTVWKPIFATAEPEKKVFVTVVETATSETNDETQHEESDEIL